MPTTTLMPLPKQQYLSNLGVPLAGGKVFTFAAGTGQKKDTYTNAAGTIKHENPIQLNLRGEPDSPIYWSGNYRVEVRNKFGSHVYTVDNYNTDPGGLLTKVAEIAESLSSFLTGFTKRDEKNGADFGMVADWNGASGTDNTAAFNKALAAIKLRGGGELTINPGDYYMGAQTDSRDLAFIKDLSNARINAYGARFIVNTTALSTPACLAFENPNNVTLAGASFTDIGFSTTRWTTANDRWGALAVRLNATKECSGFRMVDCHAKSMSTLLVADLRQNKRKLKNITVDNCTADTLYYGVNVIYVGDNLKVDLACKDVRRGLIGFGMRNFDANIKLYSTSGFPGSNAFISIADEGQDYNDGNGLLGVEANVSNGRIKLNVSGYEAHSSYVHFYHQQANSSGGIYNIQSHIFADGLSTIGKDPRIGPTSLYLVDHELPSTLILGATARTLKNINLDADVIGAISGPPVLVKSTNLNDRNTIALSPSLARLAHSYDITPFTADTEFLTPFERVLKTLVPVGETTPGVATGLTCSGTWMQIGKRVFFNAMLSWTGHTGTGGLRVEGLPKPVDTNTAFAAIALTASGVSHPAGTTVTAIIGGTGNNQIILYKDDAGNLTSLPMDPAVDGLYLSGSYVTP